MQVWEKEGKQFVDELIKLKEEVTQWWHFLTWFKIFYLFNFNFSSFIGIVNWCFVFYYISIHECKK